MISIASSPPWSRFSPVCQRYGFDSDGSTPGIDVVLVQVAELGSGLLVLIGPRLGAAGLLGEALMLVHLGAQLRVLGLLLGEHLVGTWILGLTLFVGHRSFLSPQPPIGALGFAPQKTRVPIIPMMCTRTMLRTIDFAVAVPDPDRSARGGVAVVAADEHDRGRHEHRLDQAE